MIRPEPQEPRAIRTVHLNGGLRAVDLGNGPVTVELGPDLEFAALERPPYARLYGALAAAGLSPVGVDFVSHQLQGAGLTPPDWRTYDSSRGFPIAKIEQDWGDVRNVEGQRTPTLIDIALRFQTYLRLLNFRVRQLSVAYQMALFAKVGTATATGQEAREGLFAGAYLTDVEAAIHAFLADAAGLRDLIAEAVWRLVLDRSDKPVTTFSALLKNTRSDTHPLALELQASGAEGGWLRTLTLLRNAVTHVAPVAQSHELHMMDLRRISLGSGSAPYLHYPLTTSGGEMRARQPPLNPGEDRAVLVARLQQYREFVGQSVDALDYAVATANRLADMAERVRLEAGLRSEMLVFDQSNIIGPVRRIDPKL